MDSLLRRRARGTAESRLWGDGTPGDHLDADELSAFAEGALPAAARLAAASHLADCARCRGVVVGLAPVAGVGAEVKHQGTVAAGPAESARPSAWRAFVASLFAPRMMRYAVPVLALSLVGVVSYVALRSDMGGALQAAREGRSPNAASQSESGTQANSNTAADSNVGLVAPQNNNAPHEAPVAVVPPVQEKGHGGAEARPAAVEADNKDTQPPAESPASPPPPPAAAATEGPANLSKAAPKPVTSTEEGEAARADNKEKSESRDKSARGSEPADDAASNDAAMQQRNVAQRSMNQMPDGGTPRNSQKRAADNNASGGYIGGGGAPAKESERAGARSETAGRARTAREPEKKADEDETNRGGETLNAAGHRFRREGSAWVDVNYKSSMPSTGVRRGTEPFRALVADVPEVGRVAQAIGGEVVVVVRGRAYRIR
jgi:hypothetical protein